MTLGTQKKRLLSGMQPTGGGQLHLGNLEGALRPWVRLQDQYEMFCFIADWHSLTTVAEQKPDIHMPRRSRPPSIISRRVWTPAKCAIFRQSDVKEHAELHLLLSMTTPVGWLERVPTYKVKRELVQEHDEQVSYGLLGYPVLQSADIVLYRAILSPSGATRPPIWRSPARSPGASTASSAKTSSRNPKPSSAKVPVRSQA